MFLTTARARSLFYCLAAFGLLLYGLAGVARAETAHPRRQVLILYSLGSDSSSRWQTLVHKGLQHELGGANAGITPGIYEERFDAVRVGEAQALDSMAPYLRTKYARVRFDAIIAENYVAAGFLSAHPELFPGAARYYVNHGRSGWEPADGAGLEVESDFSRAVGTIPLTMPEVRRVVVVGDQSARAQKWIGQIRNVAPQFSQLAFEYWDQQTYEDLLRRAAGLDRSSAIFLLTTRSDGSGATMNPTELARQLASASTAPIFTNTQSLIVPGVVGGYAVSGEAVGRVIGRILLGLPATAVDVQGYYFDYPSVRRFGLNNLPHQAVILNRPENVWDRYRWQIIAGISAIVIEAVLITALVVALRDRRRMLADLDAERNNLEDRVLQRTLELLMANTKLEQLATTDPLTGIANRRKMTAQIASELERARRFGHPLSLLMVDIDYFKRINDTFGHEVGDKAIMAVSKMLTESLRAIDMVARFGGEEFVVLMPETDLDVAVLAAERLRETACALRIEGESGAQVALTLSVGVASALANGSADTPSSLLVRSDKALYRAKKQGRNRVVPFTDAEFSAPVPAGAPG
ncbi:GGDEF domain-containing protein [Massilia endophytica]|uniref:GGDEF domain-containing protein n=1 Tax=Massilia endophytica TaxID=2899220 RepID=UPI001E467521|nr:GGDEF domain-containing protein [Massilia endophytica]UGQ44811.1 diguanylate cyclase [Massilia endophytica]